MLIREKCWHKPCSLIFLMSIADFIVIYLSCGAPVGVYYWLEKRTDLSAQKLWFGTLLRFFFWVPFIGRLVAENLFVPSATVRSSPNTSSLQEKRIGAIQKQLETQFRCRRDRTDHHPTGSALSVYEFREILQRYTGLTLASEVRNRGGCGGNDLFSLSGHPDAELGQICLNRRNRNHISFHQTKARRDFLRIIDQLTDMAVDNGSLGHLALEFAMVLNDQKAFATLSQMFENIQQTGEKIHVKPAEEQLWETNRHTPKPDQQIPIRLRAIHALEMNSPKKD